MDEFPPHTNPPPYNDTNPEQTETIAQPLTDDAVPPAPTHTAIHTLPADETERLKALADKRFKALSAGHGVPVSHITMKSFEARLLNIQAVTKLKTVTKLATRQQAGKVNGPEIIANASALTTAVQKEEAKVLTSPDLAQRVRDLIIGRKDQGITLKNVQIKTPFLHKDFVYYEPCKPCGGKGKSKCTRCHGKGMETCPRCYASGMETCGACGGRQYIQGANGQDVHCQRCNGMGKVSCSVCHQSKQIQCGGCRATGTIQCKQCNGHALISHLTKAEININADYFYDQTNMSEALIRKMDEAGANISDHAFIAVEPALTAHGEASASAIDIAYVIKLPEAQMIFEMPMPPHKESREIPVSLFGKSGALYNAPPYLETLMAAGIKHLEAAASGHGDIHKHLSMAIRYKTLRMMMVAVSKLGPKKAAYAAIKKIEIGLTDNAVKKLALLSDKALNRYARKDSYIGMAIGGVMAIAAAYLYVTGLRALLMDYAANPTQTYMIDIAALGLAGTLAWFATRLMSEHGKKRGLQTLLSEAAKKKKAAPEISEDKSASDQ